jgi:hypothetical protein
MLHSCWVLSGWVLILFVNISCRFVEILPSSSIVVETDENGNNVTTTEEVFASPPIPRGIHRGQLLPSSSCQAWGLYSGGEEEENDDDLQLDTSMVITRVVASLSVATSLVVLIGLVWSCMVRPLSFVARWALLVYGSIVTAALQARTRLYVHGNLCDKVLIDTQIEDGDQQEHAVVYDTCSTDTIAFHLTSATIIIFILAAVLTACDSPYRRVRHVDNTPTTPSLEPAVVTSGPAQQQQQPPRQRSGTIESFTSRRSYPVTPASTAKIFPEKEPV